VAAYGAWQTSREMYAKTNPGQGQLGPRRKRVLAISGIAVVLGFGGLAAWGALAHDPYAGCVNVTIPSSTGGATLHYCGAAAKPFCEHAFTDASPTQVDLHARPACRQAGLSR
jgi:hypothetical protein